MKKIYMAPCTEIVWLSTQASVMVDNADPSNSTDSGDANLFSFDNEEDEYEVIEKSSLWD